MGTNQSSDIAQEIMADLFHYMDKVDNYINDVDCFNNNWLSHLKPSDKVLQILHENNFTVDPFKCELGCTRKQIG